MNRLTARTTNGHAYYPECFKAPCNGDGCKKEMCDFSIEICSKLADYEDTGLTPEQIRQIDELYAEKCRELSEEKKKHEWNVIKYREEDGYLYNLPEDGQRVLVSCNGYVEEDEFYNGGEDGCYFERNVDVEEGMAWMPLPEPYKTEGEKYD